MRRAGTDRDSYTGQAIEEYVSKVPGIKRDRQSFWRRDVQGGAQVGYEIMPVPSPVPPPSPSSPRCPVLTPTEPHVPSQGGGEGNQTIERRWELKRMSCEQYPAQSLITFPSPEQAQRAAEWALRNDDSVKIALHWITKGDIEPYFRLLAVLTEAAQ